MSGAATAPPPDAAEPTIDRPGPTLSAEAQRERDNSSRLDGCARHCFISIRFEGDGANRSRWRCAYCKGEADGKAVRWYNIGVRHGGAPAA